MAELADYVDARTLLDEYTQMTCPDCGVRQWFRFKRILDVPNRLVCEECNNMAVEQLEYPCPECGLRMHVDDGEWNCRVESCPVEGVELNKEAVLDRLSSDAYPSHAHKPGVFGGDCPACGTEGSVNGDPDGGVQCNECDFSAWQYSDAWYAYGMWMENPDKIRVNL